MMITPELTQAFAIVLIVTVMASILSPVLWWILPDRTRSV
jgi:hypothetical protein